MAASLSISRLILSSPTHISTTAATAKSFLSFVPLKPNRLPKPLKDHHQKILHYLRHYFRAFTPTCSQKHLPGFVEKSAELKSKGVDTIACISVNDAFVMRAWKENLGIGDDGVLLLSDGNGDFTKAIGCELDLSDKPIGLGVRSRRYALLAEDGVVKVLNLEEGGAFTSSGAEDMLKAL
ncbi:hypothetical protein OIU77_004574 [Salix suchowensis]|uniref:Glutaredoxin-dependent peroxiredoxin n=1 Tax=Salix suchowensis TaxID=1278906 RepID=A0ABQ9AXN8_9ROSI|nr:hypothetical protein OIU77_004574 [Salix suchowensis]